MKEASTEKKKVWRSAAGNSQGGGTDTPPRVLPLYLSPIVRFLHFVDQFVII